MENKIKYLIDLYNSKQELTDTEVFDYLSEEDDFSQVLNMLEDAGVHVTYSNEENIDSSIATEEDLINLDVLSRSFPLNDPVRMFTQEISIYRLLTHEEEINFSKAIKEGIKAKELVDSGVCVENFEQIAELAERARITMINHNYRLVVHEAKKFINRGLELMDLISEGTFGLMKAVTKFDYEKGNRFSTFATYWIRQSMQRAISCQSRMIRIPVHMEESQAKLAKVESQLQLDLNRQPTDEEICEAMEIDLDKLASIRASLLTMRSLDNPIGDEGDSTEGDRIADETNRDPFEIAEFEGLRNEIYEVLQTLTEREREIIMMRCGFTNGRIMTLEEISVIYNLSRERIRQIENKALKKLKNTARSKKLKDFLRKY